MRNLRKELNAKNEKLGNDQSRMALKAYQLFVISLNTSMIFLQQDERKYR